MTEWDLAAEFERARLYRPATGGALYRRRCEMCRQYFDVYHNSQFVCGSCIEARRGAR